jgi:hypothetical protein
MSEPARHGLIGLSELASRVAQAGCTSHDADPAMRALREAIENLAARVVSGSNGRRQWIAQDFVTGSSSLIFEELRKGNYDPIKGPFKAWCDKVLRTRFISELRKHNPHRLSTLDTSLPNDRPTGGDIVDPATDFREAVDLQDYRHEPLSEIDLQRIGRWQPRHRVILLSLALLWTRVPASRWSQWCTDCNIAGPFPPADFLEHTPQECQEIVADALGIKLNNLYVLKHRMADRLIELDSNAPVVKHILRRRNAKIDDSPGGAP